MIESRIVIEKTAKFLKENKVFDFETYKFQPLNAENSPWMQICYSCIKRFDLNEAKNIKQLWDANNESFQTKVLEYLCDTNSMYESNAEACVVISFSYEEWIILLKQTCVNGEGRVSFKASMGDAMSYKLQRLGVKCWLRHKFNYIHKRNTGTYWVGKYCCMLQKTGCSLIYDASITNDPKDGSDVIMKVTWNGSANHKKIDKPGRCIGELRQSVAHLVTSIGVQNTIVKYNEKNMKNENDGEIISIRLFSILNWTYFYIGHIQALCLIINKPSLSFFFIYNLFLGTNLIVVVIIFLSRNKLLFLQRWLSHDAFFSRT